MKITHLLEMAAAARRRAEVDSVSVMIELTSSRYSANPTAEYNVWDGKDWIVLPSLKAALGFLNGMAAPAETGGTIEDDVTEDKS